MYTYFNNCQTLEEALQILAILEPQKEPQP